MTTPTNNKVTLVDLCNELKIDPRDARMMLRLAAKKSKDFPTLGRDRAPRAPWEWPAGSKGLAEARKALAAAPVA